MMRFSALALAAGLLALPLATSAAQGAPEAGRGHPGMRAAARHPGMRAMHAAPVARLIAQRERLKLTDEQVTRLTTIQKKYIDLNRPQLDAIKAARADTAGRTRPDRSAHDRSMTPEQRLEMRQQMLDRQKAFLAEHPEVSRAHAALSENARKAQEEVQAVLTEEQKLLVAQQRQRMERRHGEMRRPMRSGARHGA